MNTTLETAHNYGLGGLKLDELLVADFSKRFIKKHSVYEGSGRWLS